MARCPSRDFADERLPELAARWARIEEFELYTDPPEEWLLPQLAELVGLARRATAPGEHLYCWICL